MSIADKPYAELIEAARGTEHLLIPGLLKAAKVLPPERSAMMMAAFGVYMNVRVQHAVEVALGSMLKESDCEIIVKARDAVVAFFEEARWRAL
ncbi:hypothetical protein WMF38_57645 [Sorangium sp. So ce118]